MDTCICMTESLLGLPETITLLIGYTPIQNKKVFFKEKRLYLSPSVCLSGSSLSPLLLFSR